MLLLLLHTPDGSAGTKTRVDTCEVLAFSPDEAHDHTWFCAAMLKNEVGQPTGGASVQVSQTSGRTWRTLTVTGLQGLRNTMLTQLVVSPHYASDHTLFLQTLGNGLYESVDGGSTWVIADALATSSEGIHTISAFTQTLASGLPSTTMLAFADTAAPALIVPPAVHAPVAGVPNETLIAFFLPPTFPASEGFAGAFSTADYAPQLFSCNAVLACKKPLFKFPAHTALQSVYFAGGYPGRHILFAKTASSATSTRGALVQLWRSVDDGKTFAPWTAAQRLLPASKYAYSDAVGIATNPHQPHVVYLNVDYKPAVKPGPRGEVDAPSPPFPPTSQIFRSSDDGNHWIRVSYGTASNSTNRPPRGNIPWLGSDTANEPAAIFLTDTGKLALSANQIVYDAKTGNGTFYSSVPYCSTDSGRTWRRLTCAS